MGIPLSVLRGSRLPGEAWTKRDAALAQAAKTLDWSRCSGCGQPRWLAHNQNSYFTPKRVKCESCEAIEVLKAERPLPETAKANAYHYHTEYLRTGKEAT